MRRWTCLRLAFSQGAANWRPLAQTQTALAQVTIAGEIFGLGAGSLFRYPTIDAPAQMFLSGEAGALPAQRDFLGDAQGDTQSWSLALITGKSVTSYSSANGAIEQHPVVGRPVQIRFSGSEPVLVLDDGSIALRDGRIAYGQGTLPFAPESDVRLAQGENDTVLIGGTLGRIVRYSWNTAQLAA